MVDKRARPGRWGAGLSFCLLIGSAWGCDLAKGIAYYTAPRTEKIPAEFGRLENRKVVVYTWAPPEILWDYPKIRLDLSAYVTAYLRQNVKGITLIDPAIVEAYLEKRGGGEHEPTDLGRHFEAEMVVHLALYRFSMRDPGMAHFLRGRAGASVVVYDLTADGPADRVPLPDVNVAVPESGPAGFIDKSATEVRQMTYEAFALAAGRKFHDYERPLD